MEFIKSWKFMAIIVAVLCVVAVAGVIYGVVTHEEPGLTSPENSWNHIPLTVGCRTYAGGPDRCDVAANAISTVNTRLGFTMLDYRGTLAGDIYITMSAPVEVGDGVCSEPGECFELTGTGTTYAHCDVRVMNVAGGGDLEWLVTYHGLGHCLGLAHDDFELSIMRPVQRPTPDGVIPPWISDYDRGLLRSLYSN